MHSENNLKLTLSNFTHCKHSHQQRSNQTQAIIQHINQTFRPNRAITRNYRGISFTEVKKQEKFSTWHKKVLLKCQSYSFTWVEGIRI